MTTDRLTRLEDLTRRYARYRPCGAGLGVMWGGVLLAALAALFRLDLAGVYRAATVGD